MKAWIYKTSESRIGGIYDKEFFGRITEINSIDDLFQILNDFNTEHKLSVDELVISSFDQDDLAHAKKYKKPIADIKVEIYDDYRE